MDAKAEIRETAIIVICGIGKFNSATYDEKIVNAPAVALHIPNAVPASLVGVSLKFVIYNKLTVDVIPNFVNIIKNVDKLMLC